jgi:hypothetical protein
MAVYDVLGNRYSSGRHTDPRIERVVMEALASGESVINVGAGTGSYEPTDRRVLAIEPSSEMLRQRPPDAAPAIQAIAEALPVKSRSFDVATAILTVHHWTDRLAGYRELRRVAERVVVLTYDPDVHERQWIVAEYAPEVGELDRRRGFTVAEVVEALDASEVVTIPIPADCTDGFLMAFWRRPEAYLDPEIMRTNSGFALSEPKRLREGLQRLQEDLRTGAWHAAHADLLDAETYDAGLRLIVGGLR